MTDNFRCPLCSLLLPGQSDEPHTWVIDGRWEKWPEHYTKPRVCTGCGGCHPEDVIKMMKDGWTDEMADCRDKGYLHPPGYKAEVNAWSKSVDKQAMKMNPDAKCSCEVTGIGDMLSKYPSHPLEGPPVKFYVYHFDQEQLSELNKLHIACRSIP